MKPPFDEILSSLGRTLVTGSLTDRRVQSETDGPVERLLPEANVVKIGGQSVIDRGRKAVFPLLEELVENLDEHQMILGTGAGTRARHAYSVGMDLGLPTGVLGVLGTFVSMQNARMIHYLLAKHGIPFIEPIQYPQLPLYLAERRAVVVFGMPPYTFWQQNPAIGRIPPHRTDTGSFLVAEVFGVRSMTFVKDEDGLFTADPKKDPDARHIPRATIAEIEEMGLGDLVVERAVLDLMKNARHCRQIRIVNGLEPGNLTRALAGEDVGTLITAD